MKVPGSEWQGRTGESWATEWRRTDRSFAAITERLLQAFRDIPAREVLDVGCGAGELSLAVARARPDAQVTGVDISPALVETARERAAHLPNARFFLADAAVWRPSGARPDLVVSRHGVMFFDDPVAAFANLAGGAAPGCRLAFSCFRAPGLNPFFTDVGRLLPPPAIPADPHAPGPFAFADPARVEAILAQAGWHDIACEPFDCAMVVGAGDYPVEDAMAYFHTIGPAGRARADLPETEYAVFRERLRALVESRRDGGIVAFGAAIWIVTALKA